MALRLALDTNRYTDPGAAVPEVVQTLEGPDQVDLPFIVLAAWGAGAGSSAHAAAGRSDSPLPLAAAVECGGGGALAQVGRILAESVPE